MKDGNREIFSVFDEVSDLFLSKQISAFSTSAEIEPPLDPVTFASVQAALRDFEERKPVLFTSDPVLADKVREQMEEDRLAHLFRIEVSPYMPEAQVWLFRPQHLSGPPREGHRWGPDVRIVID